MRPVDRTLVCMLQDSMQAQTSVEYKHQSKKYYLCWGGCLAAFAAKAEQYSMAVDPVIGGKGDTAMCQCLPTGGMPSVGRLAGHVCTGSPTVEHRFRPLIAGALLLRC